MFHRPTSSTIPTASFSPCSPLPRPHIDLPKSKLWNYEKQRSHCYANKPSGWWTTFCEREDYRQKRLDHWTVNGQPAAWILRGSSFFARERVRSTSEIHSINISQYTRILARKYPIKCADNLLYSIYATLMTSVRRFGIFNLALESNSIRYSYGRITPQRVPFW